MIKRLFALIALTFFLSNVQAGTVYRDRYIPTGVCIVDFYGLQINAALIQQIQIGRWDMVEWKGVFSGGREKIGEQSALRVTLINGQIYEMPAEKLMGKPAMTVSHQEALPVLKVQQDAFLKQIKDNCK